VLFGADTQSAHPVYALYPSKHFLSAKVRVFMEMLEQLVEPTTLTDQRRKPPRTPTTPARAQRR
jgi:hypothetical protein